MDVFNLRPFSWLSFDIGKNFIRNPFKFIACISAKMLLHVNGCVRMGIF